MENSVPSITPNERKILEHLVASYGCEMFFGNDDVDTQCARGNIASLGFNAEAVWGILNSLIEKGVLTVDKNRLIHLPEDKTEIDALLGYDAHIPVKRGLKGIPGASR